MRLFESTGFNLAGKIYEAGETLTEKEFPSVDHVKLCISKGYVIERLGLDVEDAEIIEIIEDEETLKEEDIPKEETIEEDIPDEETPDEETSDEETPDEDIYDTMSKEELVAELTANGVDPDILKGKQVKTLLTMIREEK